MFCFAAEMYPFFIKIKKGYFCLKFIISKATSVHACMNLERGIIQHPGIKEVLIRLCAEYSATYNFKIAMMYNE